jgi:hypothetical protein
MKFWIIFAVMSLVFGEVALADTPAVAVREGSGGSGGSGRALAPEDNASCDKKKLSACRAERTQGIDGCKFNLQVDCKGHVSLEYSECKVDAGC